MLDAVSETGPGARPGVLTLADLRPGDHARVLALDASVPPRVFEMGVLPGTDLELVRTAPLGDPLDIRVRGFHLSLRLDEAAGITVERRATGAEPA